MGRSTPITVSVKAVRIAKTNDADNSQKKQVKGKMVKYLGTKDSTAYKKMQQAIDRRNEMSAIGEEAHCLDKEVSVAQPKKSQPRKAALTTLVRELSLQVQTLVEEIAWMKRQFVL